MTEKKKLCSEMEPLLDSFHDKELDVGECASVENHLGECASCQSKLSDIERVAKSVAGLPRLEMDRDIDIDSLLAERTVKDKSNVRIMWTAAAAAAAAVFLIVVLKVGYETGAPIVASDHKNTVEQPQAPAKVDSQPAVIAQDVETVPDPNKGTADAGQLEKPSHPFVKRADRPVVIATKTEPGKQAEEVWEEQELAYDRQVEIAFLSDEIDDGFANAVGLDTDEDGLYVLKM
jgi:hypothetical protein